jgi:hypothetical protein
MGVEQTLLRKLRTLSAEEQKDILEFAEFLARQRHRPAAKRPGSAPFPAEDFWQPKSLEDLAAQQGVTPVASLEAVLGRAADLWKDEAEFDRFLQGIYERRRENGRRTRRKS